MGFLPLSPERLGMTPEEFFAVLQDLPPASDPVYRLYHDDQGAVLFYSMEDLPGTWISVDSLTYTLSRRDVRVVDGRLLEIPKVPLVPKLRPSDQGICCDPRDICIVVTADQPHIRWSL